jgi:hypothetical protein
MAETLRIARGSVDERTAAMLASAGNFTVEWYDEIIRDGILVQEVIQNPNYIPPPPYDPNLDIADDYNDDYDPDDEDWDEEERAENAAEQARYDAEEAMAIQRIVEEAAATRMRAQTEADALSAILGVNLNPDNITVSNVSGPITMDSNGTIVVPVAEPIAVPVVKAKKPRATKAPTVVVEAPKPVVPSLYDEMLKKNIVKTINFFFDKADYAGYTCVVIGCGGTGGRLIELLAQTIMSDQKLAPNKYYDMYVIDADNIEMKNLSRQSFYEFELGMNKADALATRCNLLYGTSITAITQKITQDNTQEIINMFGPSANKGSANDPFIIFDCTDNMEARKSIDFMYSELYNNYSKRYLHVSCGNEFDYGQVILSNSRLPRIQNYTSAPQFDKVFRYDNLPVIREVDLFLKSTNFILSNPNVTQPQLPSLFSIYKEFRDSETSCAEIAAIREQSMPINSLIANLAFTMFSQITGGANIKNNLISCNTSALDFSSWNFSQPDNYMKLMVRSIYGNKLMPDEIQEAKEFFAQTATLLYAGSNKRTSNTNQDVFGYLFLNAYLTLIDSQNKDMKNTFYQIIKHYMTEVCTTWVHYPLVQLLKVLYRYLAKGPELIEQRDAYVKRDGKKGNGLYSHEQIYYSFINNSTSQNMWIASNKENFQHVPTAFAAFTADEKVEIDMLFFNYMDSIKNKVQVSHGTI